MELTADSPVKEYLARVSAGGINRRRNRRLELEKRAEAPLARELGQAKDPPPP